MSWWLRFGGLLSLVVLALLFWMARAPIFESADPGPTAAFPGGPVLEDLTAAPRGTLQMREPSSAGIPRGSLGPGIEDRLPRFRRKFRELPARRPRELEADPQFERLLELDAARKMALVDPGDHERLKQVLAEMKGGAATIERRVLQKALRDPNPEVRLAALYEISVAMDEPPIDLLAPVVQGDPDPEVRLEALAMIGDSEDERAGAVIQSALGDPDPRIRVEAQDLLDERDPSM